MTGLVGETFFTRQQSVGEDNDGSVVSRLLLASVTSASGPEFVLIYGDRDSSGTPRGNRDLTASAVTRRAAGNAAPNVSAGITIMDLFKTIDAQLSEIKNKIAAGNEDTISIGDLFEMQLLMNHLSQVSDVSSAITSLSTATISRWAREISADNSGLGFTYLSQ